MSLRKTMVVAGIILIPLALASMAAATRYLPGTADLGEVRTRVTPVLDDRLTEAGLTLGAPIHIRVFKESSELELWVADGERYTLFKTYPICSYSGELGPKRKEGDLQSPEGFYSVPRSMLNPNSRYHLSFNIGFPNAFDRSHGRTGSYLMVHGKCVSIGCYAMTDEGIEEIYLLTEAALKAGQDAVGVNIYPFRMTDENMEAHAESEWIEFWQNLRTGYDLFEADRVPPQVGVLDKRYVFETDLARVTLPSED